MTPADNERLKECPFCGSEAEILQGKRAWTIRCVHECASMSADNSEALDQTDLYMMQGLIEVWNKRADLSPSAEGVRRVREALEFYASGNHVDTERNNESKNEPGWHEYDRDYYGVMHVEDGLKAREALALLPASQEEKP